MQPPRSFLWHDYETFGTHPAADRPAQFAAQRTDARLEPVAESTEWYCAPADDMLPHPGACLVTGITPQEAQRLGLREAEFARRVHEEMIEPGTCIAGFNNLRFDDHVTRNLFYRNFFDPYAHEYSDGNSRFDLIDLARMCYALRPNGIEWPVHDSGMPSFRLEDLTAANRIPHAGAHDAQADVHATLSLARLIRTRQPKLFDWALSLRDREQVARLLDPAQPVPVLHTTSRISARRGCTSLVFPVAEHPRYRKSVIVYDLMTDPQALLDASSAELHDLVFTPRADLPDEVDRLPLKAIKINGVPMVAPAGVLHGVDCSRIGLDPDRCRTHAERITARLREVRSKVMDVFAEPPPAPPADPDLQLYGGGFFSATDRALLASVRETPPAELGSGDWHFQDPRLPEMLFRYRARNFPDTLSDAEVERWRKWRMKKLLEPADDGVLSHAAFVQALAEERAAHRGDGDAQAILDQLESWARQLGLPAAGESR